MPNKLALIKSAPQPVALLTEVRQLILAARENVARAVNASLVILYWQIGQRIRKDTLQDKRAEYGEQIIHALSEQLTVEFGRGFNWLKKNEQTADEAEPLGIILCAGKDAEHVELLELEKSGIHVASYLTKLLPKKQLELKLHEAVRLARARLAEKIQTAKGKSTTKPLARKKA